MVVTDTAVSMKLMIDLLERLSIIAILAYFFSRFKPFHNVLLRSGSVREKMILTALFGLLAVAGTKNIPLTVTDIVLILLGIGVIFMGLSRFMALRKAPAGALEAAATSEKN